MNEFEKALYDAIHREVGTGKITSEQLVKILDDLDLEIVPIGE
jgi:hypothetical protein